jgi:NAD(P)-dependent dehydrogenase (short-subunit alcohol dehydrogenase family)
MGTQTVLVVGATGNIGVAAVKGALQAGRNVLAIVRNQNSADTLIKNVGTTEDITFVEADVTSDSGVKEVVTKVRQGKLPAFQHVYSSVGGEYVTEPLESITTDRLRYNFNVTFEANFFAYRDTIAYLREQNDSSFTICTGSQGDLATHPLAAMTQGALYSMCLGAARENLHKPTRFNEVYLGFRVELDEDAGRHNVVSSTEFGAVFKQLLDRSDIRSSRVEMFKPENMKVLKHTRRF